MNEDGLFPVRQLLNWALYWAARGMPPTEGYIFTSEWVEERLDSLGYQVEL